MSHSTTQPIDDDEAFCQGDIIVRDVVNDSDFFEAYLIVTADCDIAQKKMGRNFTVLPIRKISHYIINDWPNRQLQKQQDDLLEKITEQINSNTFPSLEIVDKVSKSDIMKWISRRGAISLTSALNMPVKSDISKFIYAIESIVLGHKLSKIPFDILQDVWNALGKNDKAKRTAVREAVSRKTVSTDIHIIVDIIDPKSDIGYYIDLRDVQAIPTDSCFRNLVELKVSGGRGAFYRDCRLSDNLKYMIVQKFSNLFSRIGMEQRLERDHDALADLLPEQIVPIILEDLS